MCYWIMCYWTNLSVYSFFLLKEFCIHYYYENFTLLDRCFPKKF